uniref:PA domain-containing protein n=1 Tax=Vombatus ursinus TaxID=29139 RepID=A0A4X2L5A4_VOMUR
HSPLPAPLPQVIKMLLSTGMLMFKDISHKLKTNAYEPIAPPPLKDNSSSAFTVLIRRFDCNFDIKVLYAQKMGYKAAIVHNVESDDLISMVSKSIGILKKIDIPSVFIGEASANSVKNEFTYEK